MQRSTEPGGCHQSDLLNVSRHIKTKAAWEQSPRFSFNVSFKAKLWVVIWSLRSLNNITADAQIERY